MNARPVKEDIELGDIQRDPDVWYDDGNIILQAEKTAFQVHRSILAERSQVFKNYFNTRDYPLTGPLRRTTLNDKAADIKLMLQAIYNPNFFQGPPSKAEMNTTLTMLNLGYNYKIGSLVEPALRHLSVSYVTSFDKWDNNPGRTLTNISSEPPISLLLELIIAALLRVDFLWLLPHAVYSCCDYALTDIVANDVWKKQLNNTQREWLISSYEKQRDAGRQLYAFFGHVPAPACSSDLDCQEVAHKWYLDSLNWNTSYPFTRLSAKSLHGKYLQELCVQCSIHCREVHQDGRRKFWKDLPMSILGKTWDYLVADRERVLKDVEGHLARSPLGQSRTPRTPRAVVDG